MFSHMSFEPAGFTDNPQIPFATSIPDYVVRYLASRFLDTEIQEALGIHQVRPNGSVQDGVQVSFSEYSRSAEPASPSGKLGAGRSGGLARLPPVREPDASETGTVTCAPSAAPLQAVVEASSRRPGEEFGLGACAAQTPRTGT